MQETWLEAHAQLGRFESRANVRTWLTRIAINCAIDHLRVARRREPVCDPASLEQEPAVWGDTAADAAPERLVFAGEIGARVDQTLLRLTTLERTAFMLRHIEGMSITEIGTALGLNTSATKRQTDPELKGAAIEALFIQQNAETLVALARKETNRDLKARIVQRLSLMRSPAARDYLMELLT